MKWIFVLVVLGLSLISPYGGGDLFVPSGKAVAHKTYVAAKDKGHAVVVVAKAIVVSDVKQARRKYNVEN